MKTIEMKIWPWASKWTFTALFVCVIVVVSAVRCWDPFVIRIIDEMIEGYSQDNYDTAIQKIRRVDAFLGLIRSNRRRNAEMMRNEGRRYLVEFEAGHRDNGYLAYTRLKFFILCDLQYGNVPSSEIAGCLTAYSEKGAQLYGRQKRLEDEKNMARNGKIAQSKIENEAHEIEVLLRSMNAEH